MSTGGRTKASTLQTTWVGTTEGGAECPPVEAHPGVEVMTATETASRCTTARPPPAGSARPPCRAWTWPRCPHASDRGTTGRAQETPGRESPPEQEQRNRQEVALYRERREEVAMDHRPGEPEEAGASEGEEQHGEPPEEEGGARKDFQPPSSCPSFLSTPFSIQGQNTQTDFKLRGGPWSPSTFSLGLCGLIDR